MIPGFAQYDIRINYCGRLHREPGWSWPFTTNSFTDYDLIFTWEGEAWVQHDGYAFTVAPGSLELIRPQIPYQAKNSPTNSTGIFFFHFDFIDGQGNTIHLREDQLPPRHIRIKDLEFVEHVLTQTVRLMHDNGNLAHYEAAQYLRAIMLKASAEALCEDDPPLLREQRARIAEVIRYIRENPGEQLSLPVLADMANYSPDHFTRVFKSLHGISPKEFSIRMRLNRARTLLAETNLSVERIAVQLGYADIFFFSRQFKQRIGYSPCQWRALHQHGTHPKQT